MSFACHALIQSFPLAQDEKIADTILSVNHAGLSKRIRGGARGHLKTQGNGPYISCNLLISVIFLAPFREPRLPRYVLENHSSC